MITTPTDQMIKNSHLMGWEYLGDGLFCKNDYLGYFTDKGWVKERV